MPTGWIWAFLLFWGCQTPPPPNRSCQEAELRVSCAPLAQPPTEADGRGVGKRPVPGCNVQSSLVDVLERLITVGQLDSNSAGKLISGRVPPW